MLEQELLNVMINIEIPKYFIEVMTITHNVAVSLPKH